MGHCKDRPHHASSWPPSNSRWGRKKHCNTALATGTDFKTGKRTCGYVAVLTISVPMVRWNNTRCTILL
jgi:hypothetical protein